MVLIQSSEIYASKRICRCKKKLVFRKIIRNKCSLKFLVGSERVRVRAQVCGQGSAVLPGEHHDRCTGNCRTVKIYIVTDEQIF